MKSNEFFKVSYGLLFFTFVFCLGFMTLKKDLIPQRELASIPKSLQNDYSHLLGGSFKKAVIHRILSASYIEAPLDEVNIHLPHFLMAVDGQKNKSACEYFQTVQVTLQAEGIAVSGKKPSITLKTPCTIGYKNHILSLKFPTSVFSQINPFQMTSSVFEYEQTLISFSSIFTSWPYQWVISEISLIPQNDSGMTMHISSDDLALQSAKLGYAEKFHINMQKILQIKETH